MTSSVKHVTDAAHDQSIARLGTAANGSSFTNPERWKPIFEGSPEMLNLRNVLVRGDKVSKNISSPLKRCLGDTSAILTLAPSGAYTRIAANSQGDSAMRIPTVSYTHLTLPTILLV